MVSLRPADLAREHGLSTQAVRNYEQAGFLPPAERSAVGYRRYGPAHAAALRTFLALVPPFGHAAAGRIMVAVHGGDVEAALAEIDDGHRQLARDRATLAVVTEAVTELSADPSPGPPRAGSRPGATPAGSAGRGSPGSRDRGGDGAADGEYSIGELAHRLRLTPATVRNWERVGILRPRRNPVTGHRVFTPADRRDAELAHLLRRGGYPLARIATIVEQVRVAGDRERLVEALDGWRERLTGRGLAMLRAAGLLGDYLALRDRGGSRPRNPESIREPESTVHR